MSIGPAPLCCDCAERKSKYIVRYGQEAGYCVVKPDGGCFVPHDKTCPAYVPKHPEREAERLELVARFKAIEAELAARR